MQSLLNFYYILQSLLSSQSSSQYTYHHNQHYHKQSNHSPVIIIPTIIIIIILYSRYVHSKILGAFKGIDTREWVDAIDAQQHSQYAIYFELMRSFPNGYKLVTDILGTTAAITVAHDDDW